MTAHVIDPSVKFPSTCWLSYILQTWLNAFIKRDIKLSVKTLLSS